MTHLLLTLLVVTVASGAAAAQSLGELAKQEEARRKAIRASGKVYTDASVRGQTPPPPAPAPGPTGEAGQAVTPAAPGAAATPAPPPAPPAETDPKKDQNYWKQRLQTERDALQRAEIFAEALQSRINVLSADFVSRDDPAQRGVVSTERQKALLELERVKKEIQDRTKTIADIQEEGRKAGVPAGWYR